MEVWDLLRPSLRRVSVLAVVAVVAALAAVLVEHARAAQYDGRVSVYFAQALGLDTTSNTVDPSADQLTSVLQLPSVEAKAAAAGGVPLHVVHDASISHATGSPILDITARGSRDEATKAAPALATAGLDYFAQQGVARAQSVQASATAALASINGELATFTARAGVPDVDAAVASAAAAVGAATPGTSQARQAAANLAKYQALQPQYDLLSTELAGARASVSQAYSAVGAAQSVAKAVQLPGNVVTAPITPASRVTAYLRAAVGAAVVVVVLGVVYLALVELRRRRAEGGQPGAADGAADRPGRGGHRADPRGVRRRAAEDPTGCEPAASAPPAPPGPPVVAGDFPVIAPAVPPAPPAQPPPTDPYLSQAQRFVRDQARTAGAAREAEDLELRRRILRDAFQRVEQRERLGTPPGGETETPAVVEPAAPLLGPPPAAEMPAAPPPVPVVAEEAVPVVAVDEPLPVEVAEGETMAEVRPLFAERPKPQIRVLKALPDLAEDRGDDERANAGS